jgi:hypothetical protein
MAGMALGSISLSGNAGAINGMKRMSRDEAQKAWPRRR